MQSLKEFPSKLMEELHGEMNGLDTNNMSLIHNSVHSFISFVLIQANIKHTHLNKKHHKNITLNKINRF